MSEKTLVTIDCGISIPEGKEQVFENQHIRLEAGIGCDGTLIFRNCTIEPCASTESKTGRTGRAGRTTACKHGCINMGNNSNLEIDGCEIIHPGKNFLSIMDTTTIKNTSFTLSPGSDNVIFVVCGEMKFEGCSFVEETGDAPQDSEFVLIKCNTATMDNCTFKNITGKIEVETITGCAFTGCASIEGEKISGSTFTDCGSISVNADSSYIKDCDFTHVQSVYAAFADINDCRFQKLEGDSADEAVIYVENCTVIYCSFDGVKLRNGAYLIECVGDTSIEDCQTENCYTDREDEELCHWEDGEGSSDSLPMGLLKGVLKLAGSAVLGATGAATTIMRQAAEATGNSIISDLAGTVQDASLEKVRDMWTPDDKKDDAYYEAKAERSESRAESAAREGKRLQEMREKVRAKIERKS